MQCPYCSKDTATVELESALWLDVSARVLGLIRKGFEYRAAGVPPRKIAHSIIRGDDPLGPRVSRPRLCPYCRQTSLTVISDACLIPDIIARLGAHSRSFLLARGGGYRAIGAAFVDGDILGKKARRKKQSAPVSGASSVRARSTARGTSRGS